MTKLDTIRSLASRCSCSLLARRGSLVVRAGLALLFAITSSSWWQPRGSRAAAQEPWAVRADTVTYAFPDTAAPPFYHVLPEALAELGPGRRGTNDWFDGVASVELTADGGIVVATERGTEVRRYDARGRHLATYGRPEHRFRRISAVRVLGDGTLAVADGGVTIVGQDGVTIASHRLGETQLVEFLSDDLALGHSGAALRFGEQDMGAVATIATVILLEWRGTGADTLGRTPGLTGWASATDGRFSVAAIPFAPGCRYAASGTFVAFGWQGEPSVEVFDVKDSTAWHIRWARPQRRVTQADLDEYVARLPQSMRAETERTLSAMPIPDVHPYFGRLLVSDAGEVWVEDQPPSSASSGAVWLVFNPRLRTSGYVRTPPGFRLLDVGNGRIAGMVGSAGGGDRLLILSVSPDAGPV